MIVISISFCFLKKRAKVLLWISRDFDMKDSYYFNWASLKIICILYYKLFREYNMNQNKMV